MSRSKSLSRAEVFRRLKDQGVAKALVHYSGGGDEGGVDQIVLLDAGGKETRQLQEYYSTTRWNPDTNTWVEVGEAPPDAPLAAALCEPVYRRYGSFAGEFYVSGTITWDVGQRSVRVGSEDCGEDL